MDLLLTAEALKDLYAEVNLVVLIAIVIITQQVKHLIPEPYDGYRVFIPIGLAMMAAVLIQPVSPYAFTVGNVTTRCFRWVGLALVWYRCRKLWQVGLYRQLEDDTTGKGRSLDEP